MKKIVGIVILSFVLGHAVSQLSFGPRAGISSSKIQVDEQFSYSNEQVSYETEEAMVGFHIGAFARINLAGLYVQPEALFSSTGGKIAVSSDNQGEEIRELTYNKLDVPIMVGIKLAGILRVQAGPTFSFILSEDARETDVFNEVKQDYNQATIGYQAGVGLDIWKLYVDLKYENNLSNLGNSVSFGDQEFNTDTRNPLFILVVGYDLF